MKKIYPFLLVPLTLIIFAGCTKDIFNNYEDRIEGTWRLDDVDRIGFGNAFLTFSEGRFTFMEPGKLEYTDRFGGLYHGVGRSGTKCCAVIVKMATAMIAM